MRSRNVGIVVLVALSMLLMPLSALPAQAQPNGSFDTGSIQEWEGYMKGGLSDFWIDNPGLGSGEHWERYIEIGTLHWDYIEQFGVEKCGGGSGGCPICGRVGDGAGLYEFEYTSVAPATTTCNQVPNDGINTDMEFAIFEDPSDTGLIVFQNLTGPGDMPCHGGCIIRTGSQAWYHIQLVETIKATFTGHKVWGGNWTVNQWMDGNHIWHYQTNGGFMRQGPGNPPQMGWNIASYSFAPAPGNNGGSLASCDYDTGSKCFARS